MNDVSRRSFVFGAGVLGSAAVAGGIFGCSPSNGDAGSTSGEDAIDESSRPEFEKAPEAIADADISESVEAEVIVVGAGTAGLATALSAIEHGLKTVLISASTKPVSRGGSNNAIYSRVMEEYQVAKVPYDVVRMEMTQGSYRVDQKKWTHYYTNSEVAMDWLISIMENAGYMTVLEDSAGFSEDSPFYQPVSAHSWCTEDALSAGGGQGFVVETLANAIIEAGGSIHYNTIARQLVRGGVANGLSGRVDAVISEREDGSFAKYIGSKAVVLATGDFSGNAEMMQKYCSWAAPYFDDLDEVDYDVGITMKGLYRGDGHQMGLWVGAAWQNVLPNACMGGNICVGPWRQLQENFLGLLVNNRGERYMDEAATSALGGMPAMLQPDAEVYAIWNEDYAYFHEGNWRPFGSAFAHTQTLSAEAKLAEWDGGVENGAYIKAETLEDLIEMAGLPKATLETIERYNSVCKTKEDIDFFKDAQFLASLENGPYYAASNNTPDAMTVLGGLRTNAHMQVCSENDDPIEGLYNVGTMVGDMFGGIYTFQLQGVNLGANCICFGYLTGKYISENE